MLNTTFTFLTQLKENNNKPWFDAHKKDFETAKEEFNDVVEKLLKEVCAFDRKVESLKARDCIFRIYRDVRFSADKTPYKTHFGAYFAEGGKKSPGPGYYLHIEPGNKTFVGGGVYMPEAPMLSKIRQEIDYNGEKLEAILQKLSFKKYFSKLWDEDKLSRPPKGYEALNPRIEWLKLKSFIVSYPINDEDVLRGKLLTTSSSAFKELHYLLEFLREAVG